MWYYVHSVCVCERKRDRTQKKLYGEGKKCVAFKHIFACKKKSTLINHSWTHCICNMLL